VSVWQGMGCLDCQDVRVVCVERCEYGWDKKYILLWERVVALWSQGVSKWCIHR